MSVKRLSSLCREEQDLQKMKSAAAEFYRLNGVPGILERALNELYVQQPADVHGYLVRRCCPLPGEGPQPELTPTVKPFHFKANTVFM